MENASKALLMAGGVLIGLLVLASLMFMYNRLKSLPRTQEEILETEQLVEFNKVYESYNREDLKGTDVTSVINKAIDNNKKYNASKPSDPYYVDVEFTLTKPLEEILETYTLDGNKWSKKTNPITDGTNFPVGTYSLLNHSGQISGFVHLKDNTSSTVYCDKRGNEDDGASFKDRYKNKEYYMKNNVFVEFKRKTFTCKKVDYNNRRVTKIIFEETT